jgi:hypothetical protein
LNPDTYCRIAAVSGVNSCAGRPRRDVGAYRSAGRGGALAPSPHAGPGSAERRPIALTTADREATGMEPEVHHALVS